MKKKYEKQTLAIKLKSSDACKQKRKKKTKRIIHRLIFVLTSFILCKMPKLSNKTIMISAIKSKVLTIGRATNCLDAHL